MEVEINPAISDLEVTRAELSDSNETNNAMILEEPTSNQPQPEYTDISDQLPSTTNLQRSSLAIIIEQLANNDKVLCKSQQRDEEDINKEEKIKILTDIFEKSKSNFLHRFGQFLSAEQAKFFEQFQDDPQDGYEVVFHLRNISHMDSKIKRRRYLRNRRYAALKRLEKDSYFSETEMMKRNPLLYEQLVGQYLSANEKKMRDFPSNATKTFVGALMVGIEKEQAEVKRKQQEQAEDAVMEEEDCSDDDDTDSSDDSDSSNEDKHRPSGSKIQYHEKATRTLWGEMQEDGPKKTRPEQRSSSRSITAQERTLLKEEFVSSMYQSFLDGEDDDFDYDTVDNNEEYDNLEILAHDEEEKYFDSEEPEEITVEDADAIKGKAESSEDELDIYMSALNQHPAVCQLSEDMEKL